MSFEIRLTEGNHRGFLSNFITILTGYRALERAGVDLNKVCLLYTSPSPRDRTRSRMPSSA